MQVNLSSSISLSGWEDLVEVLSAEICTRIKSKVKTLLDTQRPFSLLTLFGAHLSVLVTSVLE